MKNAWLWIVGGVGLWLVTRHLNTYKGWIIKVGPTSVPLVGEGWGFEATRGDDKLTGFAVDREAALALARTQIDALE